MYDIDCLDSDGNTIDNFTQWDTDQKIMIDLTGYERDVATAIPQVHFSNARNREALVVRPVLVDERTIMADVPNILLTEPWPISVYVYITDGDDVSSQKTVLSTDIIVRKRKKPSNFYYVENIERITANQIKKEIKWEIVDEINQNDISLQELTFIDTATARTYKICVTGGKLSLDTVDQAEVPLRSIAFNDIITGEKYKVYVTRGRLAIDIIEDDEEEIKQRGSEV